MPLEVRTASCSGRKSSPTTPTTRTSVKKLAARAKCVAAPAEHALALAAGGFECVEGYGTYYENGHGSPGLRLMQSLVLMRAGSRSFATLRMTILKRGYQYLP